MWVSLTLATDRLSSERSTAPVTTLEANTTISVTVVDPTVETYVRTRVTGMPQICAASPTPVTRSPQQTRRKGASTQVPGTQ